MRFALPIGIVCAFLGITTIIAVSIYAYVARHRLENLEATCERISRWAREQPLPVGAHPRCQVPPPLLVPSGGEVSLVRTARGDIVVLLKTEIGWKGNYEGVLYSTSPLGRNEISIDSYGREEIAIPAIDSNPLVIRKRVNPRFFQVFFDLG